VLLTYLPPNSGGTVKLNSTDPFDKPLINPLFLTTDFDVVAMRESVRASKRFVAAPAWADSVISPFGPLSATSDSDVDEYVRGLASTVFHPVGTAAMSSSHSKSGVVNQDLLVKGADGLRVVDASVFVSFVELVVGRAIYPVLQPFIPSTHTQGPVYLLAERASDLIKVRNLTSISNIEQTDDQSVESLLIIISTD